MDPPRTPSHQYVYKTTISEHLFAVYMENNWKPFVVNWIECTECHEEWSPDYDSVKCICMRDEE